MILRIVCLEGNLKGHVFPCGQSRLGLADRGTPIHSSPGVRTPHSPRLIQFKDLDAFFFFIMCSWSCFGIKTLQKPTVFLYVY